MVDSNDRERVAEARDELKSILEEDELRAANLLVFANKQVNLTAIQLAMILLFCFFFTLCEK